MIPMQDVAPVSAFSRITHLASQRSVHEAFQWLHLQGRKIMDWQTELVAVAAPPFHEEARAAWLCERFRELGLEEVEIDASGNALGFSRPTPPQAHGSGCILISAHLDTVFPAGAPIRAERDGNRLKAPGACDNGAGLAGLLAIAAALKTIRESEIGLPLRGILFAGNVGEEGDGDLRGIRYLFQQSPWRSRIVANLVLDGAGHEIAVTEALGSRRFMVTIQAPGGHSWTDAGMPNPIMLLSEIISRMGEIKLSESPRTTLNVGTIEGGTSVNAIPESAQARFDFRSTDPEQLIRLEVELHRAVEDAVFVANRQEVKSQGRGIARMAARGPLVRFEVRKIGDRPAAKLPEDAKILELLRAVDRHLGIRTEIRTASTDANIPLSLGIEAVSIGAGGDGGGVHTYAEWFDSRERDVGLKRVLLLLLALAEVPSQSVSSIASQ
jgi:acetylornithine deacetylase/succinyl-diaminopimelate desuccinylase-like protein